MQLYSTPQRKKDLKDYAYKHRKTMAQVMWESFYKLIGKPMPK